MSQTTDQIDATVEALWPGVTAQQNAYNASNGGFYQMLWTHDDPPSAMAAPDALGDRPTDQPASAIQGLPPAMRSRMRIDTYGQPAGWTMTLEAVIDGDVWQRSIDCGVDGSRSSAWAAADQAVLLEAVEVMPVADAVVVDSLTADWNAPRP